jgi:hemerythrin
MCSEGGCNACLGGIMPLVTWDQSYSVKVSRCDNDHKKLFALINSLHDAMSTGKGAEAVQKVVKELSDYTKFHFSAEEALLEKTKYAALSGHRMLHQEFIRKVDEFKDGLAKGQSGQSIFVLNFLKDWLAKHIKETDKKYSDHLNANGVN